MFDAKKTKDDVVKWISDFFEKNGKGCNAVLGISGGKDSSVAAPQRIAILIWHICLLIIWEYVTML